MVHNILMILPMNYSLLGREMVSDTASLKARGARPSPSLWSGLHGSHRAWRKVDRVALALLALTLLLVTGCGESTPPANHSTMKVVRSFDAAQVARGKALFALHCARCHGESAQGDAMWRKRNADGTFPPPPLNGSGHAWHHPRDWLRGMIRNGSAPQGNMPAWGGQLSDGQIDDIIAWFQSLWPDEVYTAWWEMEQRSQRVP